MSRCGRRCINPNWLEEAAMPSQQRPTFPGWFGKPRLQNIFLEITFTQRDAACLLLMSSGADSVVLWVLTKGLGYAQMWPFFRSSGSSA
jgi:hypothetical protein